MVKKQSWVNLFPALLILGLIIGSVGNLISKQNLKLTGLVIMILGLILVLHLIIKPYIEKLSTKKINWLIGITLAIIIIVQIIILNYFSASVYHDPFRVLYQAELLSRNIFKWNHTSYFFRYANNVPIAILLSYWLRFTNLFGLTTNTSFHILSILLLDSFVFISINLFRKNNNFNEYVVYLLLFYLLSLFCYTYYLQVVYTDLPILLILLISFIILKNWSDYSTKKKIINGILLFILILLGLLIKANLIILAVAIIIVLFYLLVADRVKLKALLVPMLVILLAFASSIPANKIMQSSTQYSTNNKYAFPTMHWINMSYSPATQGVYNNSDVEALLKLPSKSARQNYLNTALPQRLHKLGFFGILDQWYHKCTTILNVDTFQHDYTGGYIQSPVYYQKHKLFFSHFGEVLFRVGFIIIFLLGIFSCLKLIKNNEIDPITLLAIITAVGYLAFHTFLWETEDRYGQPIFALLLIILSQTNLSFDLNLSKKKLYYLLSASLILFGGTIAIFAKPKVTRARMVVAAQRSQLSDQYDAKPATIKPATIIKQRVRLNHAADRVTLIVPTTATKVKIQLLDQRTGKSYTIKPKISGYAILNHFLTKGEYEFVISNLQPSSQQMIITKTKGYVLAQPLIINGKTYPYQSLVYTFSDLIKE